MLYSSLSSRTSCSGPSNHLICHSLSMTIASLADAANLKDTLDATSFLSTTACHWSDFAIVFL